MSKLMLKKDRIISFQYVSNGEQHAINSIAISNQSIHRKITHVNFLFYLFARKKIYVPL